MSKKSQDRTKTTGEVFTPCELVNEMLDKLPTEDFLNSSKTFLDSSCGNAQFLAEVFKRTKHLGWPSTRETLPDHRETNVKTEVHRGLEVIDEYVSIPPKVGGIFGVDICIDNVCDTIARLVLLEKTGIDFWDEIAQPKPELHHPGHNDEDFFITNLEKWERQHNQKYSRQYQDIEVRHKGWTTSVGGEYKAGAYFEYKYKDEDWKNCYNVICADALTYDYEFIPSEFIEEPVMKKKVIPKPKKSVLKF